MDDNLAQQRLSSIGNTDVVQDKTTSSSTDAVQEPSYFGPDVINDAPQQLIHGTKEELQKLLEEHRKQLRKQNKTLNESKKPEITEVPEEIKWERFGYVNGEKNVPNGYEVSTRGDSRFSAFKAKFAPNTTITLKVPLNPLDSTKYEGAREVSFEVGGMTIEYVYQNLIKKSGKGRAPSKDSILYDSTGSLKTKSQKENTSYFVGYLPLWKKWAEQNPDLMRDLKIKAHGKVLTDQFAGRSGVSQARALAQILNETDFTKPSNDDKFNTKC